jgi:poly(ADP-ribose) glycohydrolase ARH3
LLRRYYNDDAVKQEKRPLADIFIGSAVGTLVGDAFGAAVEGWSPGAIKKRYGMLTEPLAGRYTDDTQMMIGLMEALLEDSNFSPEVAAEKFLINFDPTRGYGGRIFGVMDRISKGIPVAEVGTDSWGNGAAMRIAPVGFFFYDDRERLVEASIKSARITHTHPIGVLGAITQAAAVAGAAQAAREGREIVTDDFVDEVLGYLDGVDAGEAHPLYVRELSRLKGIAPGGIEKGIELIVSLFPRDVSAIGAVPASIGAFLLAKNFSDAIIIAVNAGGDCDTTGAMAGAIAGAYWGKDALPASWLAVMENEGKGLDYVINTAHRLVELKGE